jgi:hypothetical protein
MSTQKNLPYKFILFSAISCIAIFILEKINHRFWLNDFRVYYGGAQSLLAGKQVYGVAYGLDSGLYKYSPFVALLVAPLTIFSFETAAAIQFFLIAVSIILMFIILWKIITTYLFSEKIKNQNLLLSIAFICTINHLFRELHLGNVNAELLMLLCLSLWLILQSRFVIAGILLAVVIMTKPFLILLLMPLVLRKNFKIIFSFGISLLALIIVPVIFTGFSKNIALHKDWLHTMIEHNSSFPSNNTIDSLIKSYVNSSLPASFQFYVMIAVCIGYFIFFLANKSIEKKSVEKQKVNRTSFIFEWFALIAIMPGLFKTDTQHFLLSLPLILVLLCYLSVVKKYVPVIVFILLMFFYGGNSSDLVGKIFSDRLDSTGMLGISNLILIGWAIFIYCKFARQNFQPVQ